MASKRRVIEALGREVSRNKVKDARIAGFQKELLATQEKLNAALIGSQQQLEVHHLSPKNVQSLVQSRDSVHSTLSRYEDEEEIDAYL